MMKTIITLLLLCGAAIAQTYQIAPNPGDPIKTGNATQLQGRTLVSTAPGDQQILLYDLATTSWKPGNQTAAGGVGVAPYSVTITSQTSYTITAATHGQGTYAQPFCYDNTTPRASVSCSYTRASDGQLVFTFSPAFTGQIVVMGSTGGFANPMTTAGDIIIGGASGVATRLAAGTNGYVLTMTAGVPAWAAASGGGSPGGSSGNLQYNNAGAFGGLGFLNVASANTATETLTYYNSTATTGVTTVGVRAGAGQSTTNPMLRFLDNGGTEQFGVYNVSGSNYGFKFANGTVLAYNGGLGYPVLGESTSMFNTVGCGGTSCEIRTGGSLAVQVTGSNVILSLQPKFGTGNTTGAGSAALGSNSPAVTNTAPYTWITAKSSDGSTVYIPAWK